MANSDQGIRNAIIGSVASTLIAASILYFVPSVWTAIKWASWQIWMGLNYHVALPVWLLLILSCLLAIKFFRLLCNLVENRGPTWRDYNRDVFNGMVWRWKFSAYADRCDNIWCYCPHDDTELVYSEQQAYGVDKIGFTCETCGLRFGPFEGNRRYFIASIERQIHRKLRTDEWKEAVENK